uniref:Amino Acid/Auxin Permease (AAAP) Family n=1 Tax=Angiostrongylus cantonensis TaxID=6313 RepID=A0A0K0D4N8_ANGCA
MCTMSTILFNSIMLTVLVVMLLSKHDAFVTVTSQPLSSVDIWAAAILLPVLHQYFRDALAIVVYMFVAISLYATAHVLFRATGGLHMFGGSVEDYVAHVEERRKERLYSQFFSYWTTAGDLIVYGPFEPFLQLSLSLGCTIITLVNNVLAIETIVNNCAAAVDSLSDEASKKAIRTVSTVFLALCSFFLNSKVGFNTGLTIENTVIPVATACVVLLELFIVGVFYGFPRVCANCLSMNSDKEGNRQLLRIWTLTYLYLWNLSPFVILMSIAIAFPYPPLSMSITAMCVIAFVILPTPVIGVLMVVREKLRMGNLRFLLVPDYNLWGPRMSDDRMRATRMEKEVVYKLLGSYILLWNSLLLIYYGCRPWQCSDVALVTEFLTTISAEMSSPTRTVHVNHSSSHQGFLVSTDLKWTLCLYSNSAKEKAAIVDQEEDR